MFGNLKAFAPVVVAMEPSPSTTLSHFSKWDRDALVGLNLPEAGAELSSRD